MSRDELIDLLSDVTTLVGTAVAKEIELKESLAGAGIATQSEKLESLKAKLGVERVKLAKLRDAAKRKRDLEKIRSTMSGRPPRSAANESKSSGTLTLRDGAGKVVGFVRTQGPNRTEIFSAKGKLVARETNGKTYYATGRPAGDGRQGLRVLGQTM